MKTIQVKKRRQLVAARPNPLVLEARIMFDGAAMDTVLTATRVVEPVTKDSVAEALMAAAGPAAYARASDNAASNGARVGSEQEKTAADLRSGEGALFDVGSSSGLQDAATRAQESVRNFLEQHPDDLSLFELFNGQQSAPSAEWLECARAVRQDISEGRFSVQVREVSNTELGGVFGAFAGVGPDGQPTIFINRDWVAADASADAVNRVLIEEFGHALDFALNMGIDTKGDEGEAFASAVLRYALSDADRQRIASENDRSQIYIDGQAYEVEQAALTFSAVYQGTPSSWSQEANQISNVTTISGTGFKFISADPGAPYFSGNNVSGTLSYTDTSGQVVLVDGVVSRLVKSGSTVEGLFFYVWGNTALIGDGGTGAGNDTAEAAYLLCLDPTKFSAGQSYRTSSDPVDTAMNSFLTPNSAPVATNDSATVLEDAQSAVTGNLLANDTDANADTLRVSQVTVSGQTYVLAAGSSQTVALANIGNLTIGSNGGYSFQPATNYTGAVPAITYTVTDGTASATGSFSISITSVNDAPAGTDKSLILRQGNIYTFSAADFGFTDSNDSPANALAAVRIATLPAGGTLTLDGIAVTEGQEIATADITKLRFTSATAGNVTFTFQVRDNGGTANGGINLDQSPNTINFNVTAGNSAPVATAGTATASEAGGLANATSGINPTGNLIGAHASDPDGDTLTVSAVGGAVESKTVAASGTTSIQGVYGTLVIAADGSYTYQVSNDAAVTQALLNNAGTDVFTYTVKDPAGLASTSTFTVTVNGRNDAPVAANDFNTVKEPHTGASYSGVTVGNVLTNDTDVDAGDTKTVLGLVATAQGVSSTSVTATVITLANVTGFDPTKDYAVYRGTDQTTRVGTLTKNTANITDSDGTGTGTQGTVTLDAAITISNGEILTFYQRNGQSANFSSQSIATTTIVTGSSSTVTLSNIGGTIVAGMSVSGSGITSGTTVQSVNGSTIVLSTTASLNSSTLLSFSKAADASTITGSRGNLALNANGSYTYTVTNTSLLAGQTFDETFTYTMRDSAGLTSSAVLTIRIEGTSGSTEPVASNVTATAVESGFNEAGAALGTNPSGTVSWTGGGTVTSAWSDTTPGTTGLTVAGAYGSLAIAADGTYAYTVANGNATVNALNVGGSLTDVFFYRVTNGSTSDVAKLTVTIQGANDAPVAVADTAIAAEKGGVNNATGGYDPSGNVLSNDTDVDAGDTRTVSRIIAGIGVPNVSIASSSTSSTSFTAVDGSYGTLRLGADGSYVYLVNNSNPAVEALMAGGSLTDSFSYEVTDIKGKTATATLSVTINGATDLNPPVNTLPGAPTLAEYVTQAIPLSVADADGDVTSARVTVTSGKLTIGALHEGIVSAGSNGSNQVVLSGTQTQINDALATLTYQAGNVFAASDTLMLVTTDATGNTDTDILAITVTADNRDLTVSSPTVNEASPYAVFTVSGQAGQRITLTMSETGSGSGHASSGMDYLPQLEYFDGGNWVSYLGGAVTIPGAPGAASLLVRAAILNDSVSEGSETIRLSAGNSAGESFQGTATIVDNGGGTVYNPNGTENVAGDKDDDRPLSVNSITVNEASPYAVFTVSGQSGQVVGLSLTGGTATIGTDTGASLQFYDGAQWQNYNGTSVTMSGTTLLVRAAITQDNLYEGVEKFGLVATNLRGASPAMGVATIIDDGTGTIYTGTVTGGTPDTSTSGLDDDRVLSVSSPTVNEGSNYVIFTVSGNTGQPVSLSLTNDSTNGTIAGKANVDASQMLQFWNGTAWENYDSAYLPAIQSGGTLLVRASITQELDTSYEGGEAFQLSATYASGDATRNSSGTATIVDDGTGLKYPGTVTTVTHTANNVTTVISSTPDSATDGLDDDRVLTISSPIVNEASDYAIFTVTGTPGLPAAFQLLETAGGGFADVAEAQTLQVWNGTAWVDYSGSVSFPGSGTVYVRVDIRQEQDATFEGVETLQLSVNYSSGNTTRTVTGTATIKDDGTGSRYPGTFTGGVPDSGATGLDDDRSLSVSSPTVNESSDFAVVTVTGTAGQSVSLQLIETAGAGFADIAETQTLKVWNGTAWVDYNASAVIPQSGTLYVRVDIAQEQDATYEGTETFQLRATYTSGAAVQVAGTISIVDDGGGVKYPGTFTGGTPDTTTTSPDDDRPAGGLTTVPDTASATEAGGGGNATAGSNPSGNVLGNDTGNAITVIRTQTGNAIDGAATSVAASSTSASNGATITGAYGTLTIGADGSYVYTVNNSNTAVQGLNAGGTLTDTFSYQIRDAVNQTSDSTLTVTVHGANDAPAAVNDSLTTAEDSALTIEPSTLLANDTDVDGGTLSIQSVQDAVNGSVALVDGKVVFTPVANFNGTASFSYTVSDGNAGTSTATATITVSPVNDAPVAANDSLATAEDSALTIEPSTLLANDTDVDGGTLSIQSVQDAVNGTVALVDGKVVFTPVANFNGTASFSYTVSDGNAGTSTATATITVSPVNDAPVAANASITTNEDTVRNGTLPVVSDVDGDTVTYAKASDPAHGTVTVNGDGTYTYTPAANYHGADSFSYTVSDGNGGDNTYTVSITVTPVIDAPVAANDSMTTAEDSALTIEASTLLANDTDVDGGMLSIQSVQDAVNGTVALANGKVVFTPAANFNGTASFSYTVADGNGGTSTATATITVTPVNDAPVASVVVPVTVTIGEPMSPVMVPVFTDIDSTTIAYSATVTDGSSLPSWLTFDPATRTFTGAPPAGADGSYSIRVTGNDGALSDSATFNLTIKNPLPPAQIVSIVSMTKDTGISEKDFLTSDGSANRIVSGTLSAVLGNNERLQVSFDDGTTWHEASANGTTWSINDRSAHDGDWTIKAQVVNVAAELAGATTTQNAVLDASAPKSPTVDALATTSSTPTLSGRATVGAGETLNVSVNGATYSVVPVGDFWTLDLSKVQPVSGTVVPLAPGRSYEVSAKVTDAAGNASQDVTKNELTIAVISAPQPPAPPAPAPAPAPVPQQPISVPPVVVQPTPFLPIDAVPIGGLPGTSGYEAPRSGSGFGARATDLAPEQAIRRNAQLSDVYTRSEGFRTVVAKADEPALVIFRGVPDQYTESGNRLSLTIPADAFAHTQPKEVVRLAATLQDGQPLPTWVQFDAQTGQFTGEVPAGLVGELRIKVIARDMEGREATALFRVNIGVLDNKGAPARESTGKPSLSEQLKRQGQAGSNAERLANLVRAAPAVQADQAAPGPRPS